MKLILPKGIGSWLNRLIVAVLATIPTVYLLWRIRDSAFIDGAMGNWFATMIGALVGYWYCPGIVQMAGRAGTESEETGRAGSHSKDSCIDQRRTHLQPRPATVEQGRSRWARQESGLCRWVERRALECSI